MAPATAPAPARLHCLDMLRGIAVAGMLIVNNPGTWGHVFPWLRHAGWTGWRAADLVFPFFLFVVGASAACSLAAHAHSGSLPLKRLVRILRRTALLFLLGLFLNLLPALLHRLTGTADMNIGTLRVMGVLQRIALVYLAAALCSIYLSPRALAGACVLLLLCYWALLAAWPGELSPGNNPALALDRFLLGAAHLYRGGLDPEGLLSTAPALVTALLGYGAGSYVRQAPRTTKTSLLLFCAGAALFACGLAWSLLHPVCKDLWTGPYVLVTGGCACAALSLCHELREVRRLARLGAPLETLGRRALLLFIASGIAARVLLSLRAGGGKNLWAVLYDAGFASWIGRGEASSLAFAVCWLLAWWLALGLLDRRRGPAGG